MAERAFDAVVFDFGGVVISTIVAKITVLADRHGIGVPEMFEVLMGPRLVSTDHPWHACERGELAKADLQDLLGPYAAAAGIELTGDEMDVMFDQTYVVHDEVLARAASLRREGYRTGLLTNSIKEYRPVLDSFLVGSPFDVVVDSSEVGSRKPEPEIYERTIELLGVAAERTVYLDDFEHNLVGARAAGWTTILVTDPASALVELDEVLAARR